MKRLSVWLAALLCCIVLSIVGTYETIPTHNTEATHFDTIIVLGSPPDPDGSPSSEQRERVERAVLDFRAGAAKHIILSGGAAHSKQAEAVVMAKVTIECGIPSDAVILEDRSKNTIENLFFSHEIMQEHGWTSAEIVSSPTHLPRAALILEHYTFRWSVQSSKWPAEYNWIRIGRYYLREMVGTTWLRWFGFRKTSYLPNAV